MKNVLAYIRVSTDGQCGDDKFGLDVQKQSIIEYCEKNDYNIIKWYTDEGESGAKERPGFDEIVYGDVSNPPYEAVIVAKSDRVARDINVYYYYKMLLTKTGENVKIRRSERYVLEGAGVLSGYIHMGGKIGVLVELACEKQQVADARLVFDIKSDDSF